ncbi:hypothetical protein FVEG_07680 [Fusarium verticillioides 7600]|uniref:Uncharacterized protein n=1 Tax=Gibberella moniliformis (strain M3125 / FGSC 7600) TaxID=334819 RepID=W7MIX9_GIBM7|nr:hypothetical protein FVEG_07680 [Fusarium verticillioides 7600]EWG47619.1 hypothetical protein FVEG_07680 [Fusarium verticillioides 7600]
MVRNHPEDPFQRRILVDRTSSSYFIRSQLVGAIHGRISAETEQLATLLVLSFSFLPRRANVRIKSVNISVEFCGNEDCPIISAMAPEGPVFAFENIIEEPTMNANAGVGIIGNLGVEVRGNVLVERTSSVVLSGYKSLKFLRGNALGQSNVANWSIMEDPTLKVGVPPYLQTAILVLRRADEIFKANVNVKADVSGFSFRNLQDGLLDSEDDPVIFDPGAGPLIPNELTGLDLHDLGSVDLSQLYKLRHVIDNDDIMPRITIGQTFRDLFPKDRVNNDKAESWFIDLWDNNTAADARNVLPKSLDRDELAKYFSWISETPNNETSAQADRGEQQTQQQPRPTHFCNLIARQSRESQLTTFNKLESLLNEPPVALLSDFFELPDDFEISRRHDRGGFQIFDGKDGSKAFKLYIMQTPFYSTGFWSLLLYSMVDSTVAGNSSKLSGVIQADAGVDLKRTFSDVRDLIGRHGHHRTLLPVQLFRSHYETTLSAFNSIQADVGIVDEKLLRQFEEQSKLDDASNLYRDLSMTLHKCSMKLAELGRRRKFEEELGTKLQQDLKNDSKLRVVVEIYSRMSQSRDSDIESLPGKIESQRNVLYNLITQHDSYLQARLARESLRDSKAMKTLSILTILFLPGAFIATIFSTNMFEFISKNQQVRIYFAIVIPLTAVLMICWVLWLKNTPERGDAESGFKYRPVRNMNWHKEGKED